MKKRHPRKNGLTPAAAEEAFRNGLTYLLALAETGEDIMSPAASFLMSIWNTGEACIGMIFGNTDDDVEFNSMIVVMIYLRESQRFIHDCVPQERMREIANKWELPFRTEF